MTVLRTVALITFISGIAMLAAGLVWSNSNGSSRVPARQELTPFAATPTATSTSTPRDAPTPTPTPPPFDGAIARFEIPRLKVAVPVEVLGVLPDNVLDSPHNPRNVGWYNLPQYGLAKPGFGRNALFSGHVDYYPDIIGPFHDLGELVPGDEVVVVMENGEEYRYRVISGNTYLLSEIRMGEIMDPPNRPPGHEWVTLITCSGDFTPLYPGGPGSYGSRDVIVAERVSEEPG
jgi:sortase (surface protein transpeptidase)